MSVSVLHRVYQNRSFQTLYDNVDATDIRKQSLTIIGMLFQATRSDKKNSIVGLIDADVARDPIMWKKIVSHLALRHATRILQLYNSRIARTRRKIWSLDLRALESPCSTCPNLWSVMSRAISSSCIGNCIRGRSRTESSSSRSHWWIEITTNTNGNSPTSLLNFFLLHFVSKRHFLFHFIFWISLIQI